MKIFILIVWAFCSFSCSIKSKTIENVKGIKVKSAWPLINKDGGIFISRDSFEYYQADNVNLYLIPVLYTSELMQGGKSYQLPDKFEYEYFFFKTGEAKGVLYFKDSIKQPDVHVDSFLKLRGLIINEQSLFGQNDWFYFKGNLKDKENFCVVYLPRIKPDRSYNDTSFYYFSKSAFNNDFSLHRQLDSVYKSRLYAVRLLYNAYYDTVNNAKVNRREILYYMENTVLRDRERFLRLREDFIRRSE